MITDDGYIVKSHVGDAKVIPGHDKGGRPKKQKQESQVSTEGASQGPSRLGSKGKGKGKEIEKSGEPTEGTNPGSSEAPRLSNTGEEKTGVSVGGQVPHQEPEQLGPQRGQWTDQPSVDSTDSSTFRPPYTGHHDGFQPTGGRKTPSNELPGSSSVKKFRPNSQEPQPSDNLNSPRPNLPSISELFPDIPPRGIPGSYKSPPRK